jgi:hypothetical protein
MSARTAVCWMLACVLSATAGLGGSVGGAPAGSRAVSAAVRVFDTGAPSPAPLDPASVNKRADWTLVAAGEVEHRFAGDAVLLNGQLAVVLRPGGVGPEVYAFGPAGAVQRATLAPLALEAPGGIKSVRLGANAAGAAALLASYNLGAAASVRYELRRGDPFLKTQPGSGITGLRLIAPCRFAVLPDFFADDIVADAAALPVDQADLPGENFLLHLVGDGDGIVMAAWNVAADEVRVSLAGRGDARRTQAADIPYGKDGAIWVACLEAPGVWHCRDLAPTEAGQVVPLDWRPPFPAQWRCDWRRDDALTDSWEMLIQQKDRTFLKYGVFGSPGSLGPDRKRWTTVLGNFLYPCWIDQSGQGFLQPLKSGVRFQGPAVIYPINRVPQTPVDRFTVVDVVRGTLGVGPCEYILDVEGQKSAYQGRATCSARDTLNPIYARREQKQRRAEIEMVLTEVAAFLQHIRGRIEAYVAFGHDLAAYLDRQKQAHPEIGRPIDELIRLTRAIDAKAAARQAHIKTPADHAALIADFRANILDDDGPDAEKKCQAFTRALVDIGGNQDELVGEGRWAVKVIRQRAALLAALDPRLAPIAREVRRRAQDVLRHPAGHEAPRH